MDNKNKQRLTALTLIMTLIMGGCGKNKHSSFELIENEKNEIVVMDDSYISKEYIRNYYVVEVYNKLRKENEIYICFKKIASGREYYYCGYYDVFTNLEIVDVVMRM